MSKTIVITGGTDGIGRALADILLDRGDRVTILGTSQAKGGAFVERGAGSPGQAGFIHVDLSTIATASNRNWPACQTPSSSMFRDRAVTCR